MKKRFATAAAGFDRRVRAVGPDQWHLPTPCTEWDVRALVNHLVVENHWVPHLLAGGTIEAVGDRFDGDLCGDDPVDAWQRSASAAAAAVEAVTDPDALVHVSWGQISTARYLTQLTTDRLIHAWDLARAVGADEHLDDELVVWAYDLHAPIEDELKATGLFGDKVTPPPGSDPQTRLLALAGRRSW